MLEDVGEVEEGHVALESVRQSMIFSGKSQLDFRQDEVAQLADPVLALRDLCEEVRQVGSDLKETTTTKHFRKSDFSSWKTSLSFFCQFFVLFCNRIFSN
jgi:hypothetical protein